jgi:hypothetical protein
MNMPAPGSSVTENQVKEALNIVDFMDRTDGGDGHTISGRAPTGAFLPEDVQPVRRRGWNSAGRRPNQPVEPANHGSKTASSNVSLM